MSDRRHSFPTGMVALFAFFIALHATGQPAPRFETADYARQPDILRTELSPDGAFLAMQFAAEDESTSLNLYELHGQPKPISGFGLARNFNLRWMSWSGPDWLVAGISELQLSRFGETYAVPRLVALQPGTDGAYPLRLVTDAGEWYPLDLVNALPGQPEHILITAYPPASAEPVLVNINITHPSLIPQRVAQQPALLGSRIPRGAPVPDRMITPTSVPEYGEGRVTDWYHDAAGVLRMIRVVEGEVVRILTLGADLMRWDVLDERSIHDPVVFEPLIFDASDNDVLYVVSNHAGDALGLYSYRASSRKFVREIFAKEPRPDMFEVVFDQTRSRIEGIRFADGPDGVHWLHSEIAGVLAELRPLLPDGDLDVISHDENYRTFVVYQASIDFPPKFHLYHKDTRRLDDLGAVYPKLAPIAARTQHRSIAASTGQRVLLDVVQPLANGGTVAEPRPTIIVTANAWQNRRLDFRPTVHRLVRAGYNVVLVRNVSDLYFWIGDYRPWNPVPSEALEAAADWIVENGIGDAARTCLLGSGDSTVTVLQAAARRAYACVVLEDPLVNFDGLDPSYSTDFFDLALSRARRTIPEDQRTPASYVSTIRAAVFVGYPAGWSSTPPTQYESLRRALRRARIEHEGLRYYAPRLDERIEYITRMDMFLAEHLGFVDSGQ